MAENSRKQGGPGRPFVAGQTGNPGGRPRGAESLSAQIKAQTKNGQEILDLLPRSVA